MANDPKTTAKDSAKKTDLKDQKNGDSKINNKDEREFLEEDDDFEEFPAEKHDDLENDEIEPVNIWEDNWDDDNIEDDFSLQLKREFNGRTFHGPIV